jgi:hemerythrin superfamily protein
VCGIAKRSNVEVRPTVDEVVRVWWKSVPGYRAVPAAPSGHLTRLETTMDAIELLTSDHNEVRSMFEQFRTAKEAENTEQMRSLQQQIFDELETHTRIEEDIFYPAVKALEVEDLTEVVSEGVQEHHVVKVLMREIRDGSDQEVFEAKMAVLMENVEHHAEEEESEMFPDLREHMSAGQLEELGVELQAAKSSK